MTKCFIPVLGKRLRVTQLDECGNPPASGDPNTVVVTDGFISLTLTSEIEEGTEIITRKADGSLCVNQKLADSFKRFTLEIEFCGVDPDLLSLVTNAEPYQDYDAENAGVTVAEGTINKRFALEMWTGLSGQACEPGDEEASGYLLLPFVTAGVLGDLEVTGEDAVTFSMTGAFTQGGNFWGVGPYDVLSDAGTPAPLPLALDPMDHLLLMQTGIAPPPAQCGFVSPPAAATVTSIAPTSGPAAGGTAVTITGTGFIGATGATLGGTAITGFTVVNATTITGTSAAHAAGSVAVVVLSPNGNGTLAAGYTYS